MATSFFSVFYLMAIHVFGQFKSLYIFSFYIFLNQAMVTKTQRNRNLCMAWLIRKYNKMKIWLSVHRSPPFFVLWVCGERALRANTQLTHTCVHLMARSYYSLFTTGHWCAHKCEWLDAEISFSWSRPITKDNKEK
jgi:hypothetical protein